MIWRYSNETRDGRARRIVREKKAKLHYLRAVRAVVSPVRPLSPHGAEKVLGYGEMRNLQTRQFTYFSFVRDLTPTTVILRWKFPTLKRNARSEENLDFYKKDLLS